MKNKKNVRISQPVSGSKHIPSQADYLDQSQQDMFPPAPMVQSRQPQAPSQQAPQQQDYYGPMAANSLLGGSFGSMF